MSPRVEEVAQDSAKPRVVPAEADIAPPLMLAVG